MTKIIAVIALLFVSAILAAAKPGGAPACAINAKNIEKGMGPPKGVRDFSVKAEMNSYEAGKKMTFTVNSATAKTFKGVLCYVMPKSNAMMRVGKFMIPSGLRTNVQTCAKIQAKADTDSVVTHSSSAAKPLPLKLEWMAPSTMMGDLELMCAMVGTGPSNWQILDPVILTGTGTAPTGGSGATGGAGTGGDMGMRKCKLWRKKGLGGAAPPTGDQKATGEQAAANPSAPPAPAPEGGAPPAPEAGAPAAPPPTDAGAVQAGGDPAVNQQSAPPSAAFGNSASLATVAAAGLAALVVMA